MTGKFCIAALLTCVSAFAQTPAVPAAFEVVSIHPDPAGSHYQRSMTPDGFHITQTIRETIMMAYFPQGYAYWNGNRLVNEPKWLREAYYAIDARVSDADRNAWQRQGITLDKKPMLSAMLQTMLAERCKFAFHRVPGFVEGFALVAGKRGPHLAHSVPGAALPDGGKLGSGGVMVPSPRDVRLTWTFHAATTDDLVWFLSNLSSGHPVIDRTGLTGLYDFPLACTEFDPDRPRMGCGTFIANQPNPLADWDLDSLGLHLEPIKIPTDTLVIDHIEKPSEN